MYPSGELFKLKRFFQLWGEPDEHGFIQYLGIIPFGDFIIIVNVHDTRFVLLTSRGIVEQKISCDFHRYFERMS